MGISTLFFDGVYEVLDNGDIQRTYTVYYASGQPGQFRETWGDIEYGSFQWITAPFQDGACVPGDIIVMMKRQTP